MVMAKSKRDDDDAVINKVKHELTKDEIEERREEFTDASLELMDLREKRTLQNSKINIKLKELTQRARELSSSLRDGFEWQDAQLTLAEASKARKGVVRTVQTPEA